MKSILYLGCPAAERSDTEKLLGAANVAVVWADSAAYALNELQRRDMPVLLDLSRGAGALQVAREIRSHRASTLMFAVVDARRPDLTTEAVLAGMADVFARPLGGRRVANAIERELNYETRQRPRAAETSGDELYTHSPAMRDVMVLVTRAATMRAGVMIRGEEGTGRQVTARAIHALQNSGGAFVTVDCAAYDAEGLEAVLFGTTATTLHGDEAGRGLEPVGRTGRLHEALGGTLYLQNVAEATTRVQGRLARLLRDREALLVENGKPIGFDVRPMAGVDPSFDAAVQEGRVRDDLFRRLSVLRIDMPPLRGRREDIPALANYFLRELCAALRVPPKVLSRPALSLIAALPWRGNAVELRTLLESVVHGLQGGRGIGLDDVLGHVRLDGGPVVFSSDGTLKQARARFEREYIAAVLEQHHGRITDAAKALGIQRTNLYRKIRSLRVSRSRRRG
ncbi:MAG: sigma-54-dependent Fis family transcriptional regulator [Acidobacteria bacterium]|nr:sigma-54-dependent Fis family transcriptional regulator [Acidobacteriota bacterium]